MNNVFPKLVNFVTALEFNVGCSWGAKMNDKWNLINILNEWCLAIAKHTYRKFSSQNVDRTMNNIIHSPIKIWVENFFNEKQ